MFETISRPNLLSTFAITAGERGPDCLNTPPILPGSADWRKSFGKIQTTSPHPHSRSPPGRDDRGAERKTQRARSAWAAGEQNTINDAFTHGTSSLTDCARPIGTS